MWRQYILAASCRRSTLVPLLGHRSGLAREDPVAFLFQGLQLLLLFRDSVGGSLLIGCSGTAGRLLGEFTQIFPSDRYSILDFRKGRQNFGHSLLL